MTEAILPQCWWAVARSEEISAAKPLAVDIGDQPIVLWRDRQSIVRALEDRCPHRRAPLSLGCILENGWIQCGYHGWTYEGETGRLRNIPNLKDKQKFPGLYKAIAFAVRESDGFVRVRLQDTASTASSDTPAAPSNDSAAQSPALTLSGTAHVGLAHDQYVAALFDDPGLLITIRGIAFTPYLMSELHVEDGKLAMERSCQWKGLHWPAPFSPEFPATVLLSTHPATGETSLTLRDSAMREYLRAVLAPVPAARGVTAVRWRARLSGTPATSRGLMLRFGNPLKVHETIDADALRQLKPTVSLHGAQLRAELITGNAAIAA